MKETISEDKKRDIINEYMNTKRTLRKIAERNGISYEDMIKILEEYRNSIIGEENLIRTKTIDVTKELEEQIYQLRNQGLSYAEIGEKVGVSPVKAKEFYDKILTKKVKEEYIEKKIKKDRRSDASREIDAQICKLREEDRLKYKEIAKELEKKGIVMTRQRVEQRHKRFSRIDKKQLAKIILSLKQTKNATMEQIKQIADYYGVDLEKTMDSLEER